jgi:hypothetical protein
MDNTYDADPLSTPSTTTTTTTNNNNIFTPPPNTNSMSTILLNTPNDISPQQPTSNLLQSLRKGGGGSTRTDLSTFILKEELKSSTKSPHVLLARWCVEGRAHAALSLAQEGSIVALVAQVLSTSARITTIATNEISERLILKACAMAKSGDRKTAGREFRAIYEIEKQRPQPNMNWMRRSILAAAHLASTDGDFRSCATLCDVALTTCPSRQTHIAVSRLLAELGDVTTARRELEIARKLPSINTTTTPIESENTDIDVSFYLAEAYVLFSEGNFNEAARLWDIFAKQECIIADDDFYVPPGDTLDSFLVTCVISVIVGDVGDVILAGSRTARHEAANNYAICSLLNGSLDSAVNVLEDVLKVFGAPHVFDPATATNLRTLYDLQRRLDSERLL